MRLRPVVIIPALVLGLAAAPAAAEVLVDKSATLPAIPLAEFQNAQLPGSISDDRGVLLGGIGSGLFRVGKNEYWTITDRGPNGEPEPPGGVRTFIVPEFTPTLVKVRARGQTLQVLDSVPLVTADGEPITGLPPFVAPGDPLPAYADATTDRNADGELDLLNPDGMDTEGLVFSGSGFWVVDEYGPSIAQVDLEGHVLKRFVPTGTAAKFAGADAEIVEALPAELASRTGNRGFEDIALMPDGRTIAVALQSDLDRDANGDADSTTTKLLTFDTATASLAGYYDYTFDSPATFMRDHRVARVKDLKISALVPLGGDEVLVQERTDVECRFHVVSLGADATLAGADKTLLVNLKGVAGVPGKVEGAALKSQDTLALISDNDFGFDVTPIYPDGSDVQQTGVKTTYVEVKLP